MDFWKLLDDWIIPLGILAGIVIILLWVGGVIGGGISW